MNTAIADEEFFPSFLTGGPSSPKAKSKESAAPQGGNGPDMPWAVKRGPRLTYAESLSMSMDKQADAPALGCVDVDASPFSYNSSASHVRRRKPVEADDLDDDVPPPPTSTLLNPTGFLSDHLQPHGASDAGEVFRSTAASTSFSTAGSFVQGDAWGYDKKYWVTVYGFSASAKAFVLQHFQTLGEVLNFSSGSGNWMHVRYHTRLQAEKALSYDGQTIGGSIMIGVKRCLSADVEGVRQEPTSSLYFSHARKNPGSKDIEVEPITEDDIMLPPKRRQDVCSRLMRFLFNW
ncbi:hypothetical protein P43SY_006608 [Pythium insidiosum]|uniref:RRM Nup35-type domain-containing protein n=1 Tax=Pythium insidiosum TaxID=114742 RepID=A0AAD5Q6W0_PYTIN|nr:hypothetical protein P43SY_006608 [Pythium insidiosum]